MKTERCPRCGEKIPCDIFSTLEHGVKEGLFRVTGQDIYGQPRYKITEAGRKEVRETILPKLRVSAKK